MALKATVWAMMPGALPEGENAFECLAFADRQGEEAGVRLSHVFHAIEAAVAHELAQRPVDDDPVAAPLGAQENDPADIRLAIERSVADCKSAHQSFASLRDQRTPGVKAYRAIELFVADLIAFGLESQRYILVLLVMLCAVTATLTRHHGYVSDFRNLFRTDWSCLGYWYLSGQDDGAGGYVPERGAVCVGWHDA
ncbi:hypothetical protein SAMN05216369_0781 [Marinobacter antarcticus]|uniref:Uncharacterized protein n=1 Tax=Marinobacter antarcticus TaxID=564117 RepID=A0A1M6QAA0_9GAMM|nr:hypothetical protein [Marinobacter antarcticus]SHK17013.1 hypothetical protein SAMN05216369_0781 [Marinobacter antarcticus]